MSGGARSLRCLQLSCSCHPVHVPCSDLRVLAMAALKPLMPAKMRSMAATAAAELAALSSVSVSGAKQPPAASRSGMAALVADLEGRIGRHTVISLAFSPDASLLVAGTADWRLAGWLVVAPRLTLAAPSALSLVRTFELSGAHTGAIHSVGVLGDGTVLYTSGADSSVRLWQTAKLIPAAAAAAESGGAGIETETSVGAFHPAAITQASVAGGALVHVHDDPRGGCLVSAHDAYRALFDFGLSAMPFGVPKNASEMSNAAAVDAAMAMYGHSGAPRSTPSFRLAAVPPPRLALQPPAPSPLRSSRNTGRSAGDGDGEYREGSPSRSAASPRRGAPAAGGDVRPTLEDQSSSPPPSPNRDPPPQPDSGAPGVSVTFSPPRTAAALAADRAASSGGHGRLSPVRPPAPAENAVTSDTDDDDDLAPSAFRRPLRASSLGGDSEHDTLASSSIDEPLVSGLEGESGAGSESWWAGNTDPSTWRDVEPIAVPQALLQVCCGLGSPFLNVAPTSSILPQGLVDLLDGKRGRSATQGPASLSQQLQHLPPQQLLLQPMEPTRIVRVRRACLDVAPLPLSPAEVRSRRSRPPVFAGHGGSAAVTAETTLASYTRASFAWDAFASRILYCAGSEVTLHDAASGRQQHLPVHAWAEIQTDAAQAQRRREAAAAGNLPALAVMAASPSARRGSSFSGSPEAVAALASHRRRAPRCTVLSLSSDGLKLLVGLSDCSIGLWQRAAAATDSPWTLAAMLLPPWVRRHEPPAAAAAVPGLRGLSARRASLAGTAKVAHGFGSIGSGGILVDASFGPGGLFIAATYVKRAAGGGASRSFRVLVAFWEVADVVQVGHAWSV